MYIFNAILLSYKWFVNDRPLDFDSETVELEDVTYALDQAQITCQATNKIGASTGSKSIGVKCK